MPHCDLLVLKHYDTSVIIGRVARVDYHKEALKERDKMLIDNDKTALRAAVRKLELFGSRLPFPHQSKVVGSKVLRELRPKAGRSAFRALYAQVGRERFAVVAICSEAQHDRRAFNRGVKQGEMRLKEVNRI